MTGGRFGSPNVDFMATALIKTHILPPWPQPSWHEELELVHCTWAGAISCRHSPLADIHPGSAATVSRPSCRWLLRHAPGSPRCPPNSCPAVLLPPLGTACRWVSRPGLRGGQVKPPARPSRRWSAPLPLIALWECARLPASQPAASCHPPQPWLLRTGRLPPSVAWFDPFTVWMHSALSLCSSQSPGWFTLTYRCASFKCKLGVGRCTFYAHSHVEIKQSIIVHPTDQLTCSMFLLSCPPLLSLTPAGCWTPVAQQSLSCVCAPLNYFRFSCFVHSVCIMCFGEYSMVFFLLKQMATWYSAPVK